jgi:hypothetical protein
VSSIETERARGADDDLQGADLVRAVFARVRAGDASAADLYAAHGVLRPGSGAPVEGREAIRAFYARSIESIHPQPRVVAVLEEAPLYIAVLDVSVDGARHRVLDLFELGEDGIESLEIFSRR